MAEFYSRKILPVVRSMPSDENQGGDILSLVRESQTTELGKLRAKDRKRLA